MIGNMTQWVFHVIMSSWCHAIWSHSTLEFHRHIWILSSMENISYSSDLISVHVFDIYHLIYMLCIFAVYFYLLRAHWEHFARDGYTSCALGTSIHSITSCALGTLRVCWVHIMCALGILIYDNTLCALGLLIRDIGDLCIWTVYCFCVADTFVMIMTFSGFKGYIFISALIFSCVFACMTFVGAFEPCGNMSTRTRKLNQKGTELLERNLRGKCASALRCATTVANKLGPLLKRATIDDLDLVTEYSTEFDTKISLVVDAYTNYSEKFVGDLEILGDFNSWFKPRFSVLREIQDFAGNWLSQIIDIQPDYSASQVMSQPCSDTTHKARSETSRKSKSSTGSKNSSGVRSWLSGSVASVRLRESLEKTQVLKIKKDTDIIYLLFVCIIHTLYIFSCDQGALRALLFACPFVCHSVCYTFFTMFLSSYHEIFISYYQWQKWCPCKRSRSEVKFTVTEVKTQFSHFRTLTPVWICIWWWNDDVA